MNNMSFYLDAVMSKSGSLIFNIKKLPQKSENKHNINIVTTKITLT